MNHRRAPSRHGIVTTSIALDRRLHRQLMLAVVKEGAAMTELVRQAIRDWLARRTQR